MSKRQSVAGCSANTSVCTKCIDNGKISLEGEIERFVLSTLLGSGGAEVREAIMEGLTAEEEGEGNGVTEGTGGEEAEVTEMVKVVSSLSCFELKLFKDEPPLVSTV